MTFNLQKTMWRKAMAVPMPSDDEAKRLREEGNLGLVPDVEDYYKDLSLAPEARPIGPDNEDMLSGVETLKYIPLGEIIRVPGRESGVYPVKVDKEDNTLVAYDPVVGGYVRFPLDQPEIKAWLDSKEAARAGQMSKLSEEIASWNEFLKKVLSQDGLKGANITNLPPMILKQLLGLIPERERELLAMQQALEARTQSQETPAVVSDVERAWLDQINAHTLNLRDENSTILKLYKGVEERIQRDVDSGVLDPSPEWRRAFLSEIQVQSPDGQATTTTKLQNIINEKRRRREEEDARRAVPQETVTSPGIINKNVPSTTPFKQETFSGPFGSIRSRDFAALSGVRDELKAVEALRQTLSRAQDAITNMRMGKSDEAILADPSEYLEVIRLIRDEASMFIRRHISSIQNKPKTWKKGPKERDPNEEYIDEPGGGVTSPGKLNASFMGRTIASMGIALYLHKIYLMTSVIDERLSGKSEARVPTASVGQRNVKTAQNVISKSRLLNQIFSLEQEPARLKRIMVATAPQTGIDVSHLDKMPADMQLQALLKVASAMEQPELEELARVIGQS